MKKCLYQATITMTNNRKKMLVLVTMLTLAVGVVLLPAIILQSEAKEDYRSCAKQGKWYFEAADLCIPWPEGCPDPDRVPKCPHNSPINPIEEPPAADVVQEPTDEEPPPPEDQEQGSEQSDDDGDSPPGPREEPAESAE